MYSLDDLLQLVTSDQADELRLHVGAPPVVVLDGQHQTVEGPALTAEDTEALWLSVATTRQRRELWEQGAVQFIYHFRASTDFVVSAKLENRNIGIDLR